MLIVLTVLPVAAPSESMLLEDAYSEVVSRQFHRDVLTFVSVEGIFPCVGRLYSVAFHIGIIQRIDVDSQSQSML